MVKFSLHIPFKLICTLVSNTNLTISKHIQLPVNIGWTHQMYLTASLDSVKFVWNRHTGNVWNKSEWKICLGKYTFTNASKLQSI